METKEKSLASVKKKDAKEIVEKSLVPGKKKILLLPRLKIKDELQQKARSLVQGEAIKRNNQGQKGKPSSLRIILRKKIKNIKKKRNKIKALIKKIKGRKKAKKSWAKSKKALSKIKYKIRLAQRKLKNVLGKKHSQEKRKIKRLEIRKLRIKIRNKLARKTRRKLKFLVKNLNLRQRRLKKTFFILRNSRKKSVHPWKKFFRSFLLIL